MSKRKSSDISPFSNIHKFGISYRGTTCTLLKNPPVHLKDAGDFEPLYPPQEFILEESLRREAERVAH